RERGEEERVDEDDRSRQQENAAQLAGYVQVVMPMPAARLNTQPAITPASLFIARNASFAIATETRTLRQLATKLSAITPFVVDVPDLSTILWNVECVGHFAHEFL